MTPVPPVRPAIWGNQALSSTVINPSSMTLIVYIIGVVPWTWDWSGGFLGIFSNFFYALSWKKHQSFLVEANETPNEIRKMLKRTWCQTTNPKTGVMNGLILVHVVMNDEGIWLFGIVSFWSFANSHHLWNAWPLSSINGTPKVVASFLTLCPADDFCWVGCQGEGCM